MLHDLRSAYPGVHPMKDSAGKIRWRFKQKGKVTYLRGEPGSAEFAASYEAATKGLPAPPRARKPAPAISLAPAQSSPARSLASAWRAYQRMAPEWQRLRPATRARQKAIADAFLIEPVAPPATETWGDMPVADLKRRHIKLIIARMGKTPHAARHRLGMIRKMIRAALDEEWIETDPTYGIKHRPAYRGHRAWTEAERAAFERRWPIGTTPRLCYALALWLGPRRGDIARLRVADIMGDQIVFVQGKTGRPVHGVISPMLREVLDATNLCPGGPILMTAYGKAFSPKSLTGRMRDWTESAGLPQGCTLHGLRKTLGKLVAESGGTTRQIMATLGHDDIAQAELYSREAEREMMARDAMAKVARKAGKGAIRRVV